MAARQQMLRAGIELSAEVGPRQIVFAAAREARHLRCLKPESAKAGGDRAPIESRMHGVAGARVVQRKGEQCFGRQAGAGAAKPDPRRS